MGNGKQVCAVSDADDKKSPVIGNVFHEIWVEYQWFVIAFFWFAALVLGYLGFYHHLHDDASPLRLFYLSLQLFVLESGDVVRGDLVWTLEVARILAPMVAAYTALRALAAVFYDQVQMIRLRFISDHVIICGLGRIGALLARAYRSDGYKVVAIEKDGDNDNIHLAKSLGIIVLLGDAGDPDTLRKARVDVAKYIVAGSGDDSLNAEIAWQTRELVRDRTTDPLVCFVHIIGSRLFDMLKEHPVMTAEGITSFHLCPFNIHRNGAQLILNEFPPFSSGIVAGGANHNPRVVVLGLGQFGQSIVVETAIRWRLMFSPAKINIEVIDKNASLKAGYLMHRYPIIGDASNITFRDLDFESDDFRKADFLLRDGELDVSSIYVCIDDDTLGLSAALTMFQVVKGVAPIVVRTSWDKGLTRLISGAGAAQHKNLYAFELLDRTSKPGLLGCYNDELAREFHNRYLKQKLEDEAASGEGEKPDAKPDPSRQDWDKLPESLKLSNRRQADSVPRILALTGFSVVPADDRRVAGVELTEDDIEKIAVLEHGRFVTNRVLDGWKDGPRDPEAKTSPYLIPWDKLDEKTKSYDREWARSLPEILKKVGLKICALQKDSRQTDPDQ